MTATAAAAAPAAQLVPTTASAPVLPATTTAITHNTLFCSNRNSSRNTFQCSSRNSSCSNNNRAPGDGVHNCTRDAASPGMSQPFLPLKYPLSTTLPPGSASKLHIILRELGLIIRRRNPSSPTQTASLRIVRAASPVRTSEREEHLCGRLGRSCTLCASRRGGYFPSECWKE